MDNLLIVISKITLNVWLKLTPQHQPDCQVSQEGPSHHLLEGKFFIHYLIEYYNLPWQP